MKIVKNIYYAPYDKMDFSNLNPILKQLMCNYECAVIYTQQREGIRLFVTNKIIEELTRTDFKNILYSDIKFPANSVEIYFESKDLPTVLITKHKTTFKYAQYMVEKIGGTIIDTTGLKTKYAHEGIDMIFGHLDGDDSNYFLTQNVDEIEKWLNDPNYSPKNDYKPIAGVPASMFYADDADNSDCKQMAKKLLMLIIKVFLYISIPQYKAISITDKALRREGKSGVNNRPNRPLSRVIYVPTVINTNKKITASNETGEIKSPHYRRGHFIMLRHERYKEQGKLIFRRPAMIHGGSISDKLYVARTTGE
jgi:hypothetical protein